MKTTKSKTAQLLESARLLVSIREAIETAVAEKQEYISYANVRTDYGDEWPKVCRREIERLNAWRDVCALLGLEYLENKCRVTAATYR